MKKYFFFDIDGTLTTPLTADYPDSTREAIRRLQRQGTSSRLRPDAFRQTPGRSHVTLASQPLSPMEEMRSP